MTVLDVMNGCINQLKGYNLLLSRELPDIALNFKQLQVREISKISMDELKEKYGNREVKSFEFKNKFLQIEVEGMEEEFGRV